MSLSPFSFNIGKALVTDISVVDASDLLHCWYRDLDVLPYSGFDVKGMIQEAPKMEAF